MAYEYQALSEVLTIKKGRKPDLHAFRTTGDIPYLVAKVMRGVQEPEWVRPDDPNAVLVTENEAIIICDGSNSGEVFSGFSGALSSTMAKIEPKIAIDQTYLRRFLESNSELFAGTKTGTAIPHLDQAAMFSLQIPLPPLPEQQRVVRLLDEAFEGIAVAKANAEKNLQNARALFESNLQAVFRQSEQLWEKKPIGEVCLTGSGGTPLSSRVEYYAGGTIPWLVSGEVAQGDVKSATHFITEDGLQNSSAKLFPAETVLVAMYGATAGQVGILRFESATNQAVCGIYPNERILPEFLYFGLLSKKRELIAQATGNAQPNISQIKIKNTQVPLPEISEQRRVVDLLKMMKESTALLENAYAKKLLALNSLKSSYFHQAFSRDRKTA